MFLIEKNPLIQGKGGLSQKDKFFKIKKPNKSFKTSYSDKTDLKHLCHNKQQHCCD